MKLASQTNLKQLVARARRLEPAAFAAIVDEFAPRVRGLLGRIVRGADIDDLVQEVFLRVVRTIERYEESGRFEAWIFQIARNVAHDHFREMHARSTQVHAIRPGNVHQDSDADASGNLSERIETALEQLPDAEREVILLRHFGRLTFEEISQMMDTPLGTALARAHRGLAKLRQWMEERHD